MFYLRSVSQHCAQWEPLPPLLLQSVSDLIGFCLAPNPPTPPPPTQTHTKTQNGVRGKSAAAVENGMTQWNDWVILHSSLFTEPQHQRRKYREQQAELCSKCALKEKQHSTLHKRFQFCFSAPGETH